jgi:hypothetical protein
MVIPDKRGLDGVNRRGMSTGMRPCEVTCGESVATRNMRTCVLFAVAPILDHGLPLVLDPRPKISLQEEAVAYSSQPSPEAAPVGAGGVNGRDGETTALTGAGLCLCCGGQKRASRRREMLPETLLKR